MLANLIFLPSHLGCYTNSKENKPEIRFTRSSGTTLKPFCSHFPRLIQQPVPVITVYFKVLFLCLIDHCRCTFTTRLIFHILSFITSFPAQSSSVPLNGGQHLTPHSKITWSYLILILFSCKTLNCTFARL